MGHMHVEGQLDDIRKDIRRWQTTPRMYQQHSHDGARATCMTQCVLDDLAITDQHLVHLTAAVLPLIF